MLWNIHSTNGQAGTGVQFKLLNDHHHLFHQNSLFSRFRPVALQVSYVVSSPVPQLFPYDSYSILSATSDVAPEQPVAC